MIWIRISENRWIRIRMKRILLRITDFGAAGHIPARHGERPGVSRGIAALPLSRQPAPSPALRTGAG